MNLRNSDLPDKLYVAALISFFLFAMRFGYSLIEDFIGFKSLWEWLLAAAIVCGALSFLLRNDKFISFLESGANFLRLMPAWFRSLHIRQRLFDFSEAIIEFCHLGKDVVSHVIETRKAADASRKSPVVVNDPLKYVKWDKEARQVRQQIEEERKKSSEKVLNPTWRDGNYVSPLMSGKLPLNPKLAEVNKEVTEEKVEQPSWLDKQMPEPIKIKAKSGRWQPNLGIPIQVTLDAFSGKENLTWALSEAEADSFVAAFRSLNLATDTERKSGILKLVEDNPLGYRGFHIKDAHGYEVTVIGRLVSVDVHMPTPDGDLPIESILYFNDNHTQLESLLRGSAKNHVPENVFPIIPSAK